MQTDTTDEQRTSKEVLDDLTDQLKDTIGEADVFLTKTQLLEITRLAESIKAEANLVIEHYEDD